MSLLSEVSVEPALFFYFVVMIISSCLNTNLLLYKACDPTSAPQVGSKCDNEKEAQHVVASINAWKTMIQQLVPIALAMIAGTWSDLHGRRRKPLIVLPIVGQIASDALSMYCTVEWSVSPAMTAVLQVIMLSFSGGPPVLYNGVNSYVADTSSEEWRTIKYGVLNGVMTAGCIMGMLVYGCVIVRLGLVSAYALCVGLGIVALVLTYAFINEVAAPDVDDKQTSVDKVTLCQDIVRTINPIETFRNCYRVLTKRRQGHNTAILCLVLLACAPLTCVPFEGEFSVIYLFLRYKFQFGEIEFGIFNAYIMAVVFLGNIFALSILSHKVGINDASIGIIASICDLLAAIAFFLVSQTWQVYLVPPLELFRGASLAITSSIASKFVEPTELGAMNSVKQLIESTSKSGFLPLYNIIYNNTLESIPSAFFLISIFLTAPLILIFWLIKYLNQGQKSCSIDDSENRKPDNNEISTIERL
ncbi:Major facilitator superfamily,Major facilitator superfamily domain [Cinara cedri]|uniref:Major facilitator superfamily,Major facilitator superfamily domain n=1 Tax=Cinara cedri TaxID=506608 RepID=A0A5E4N645_9HEMI|nr:Major facilitator superfamily,Major facilitator superfamily domain [Cinara cedri]